MPLVADHDAGHGLEKARADSLQLSTAEEPAVTSQWVVPDRVHVDERAGEVAAIDSRFGVPLQVFNDDSLKNSANSSDSVDSDNAANQPIVVPFVAWDPEAEPLLPFVAGALRERSEMRLSAKFRSVASRRPVELRLVLMTLMDLAGVQWTLDGELPALPVRIESDGRSIRAVVEDLLEDYQGEVIVEEDGLVVIRVDASLG